MYVFALKRRFCNMLRSCHACWQRRHSIFARMSRPCVLTKQGKTLLLAPSVSARMSCSLYLDQPSVDERSGLLCQTGHGRLLQSAVKWSQHSIAARITQRRRNERRQKRKQMKSNSVYMVKLSMGQNPPYKHRDTSSLSTRNTRAHV